MSTTLHQKRCLSVLGYTENPQADGTITLPRDYFGKPNQAQRVERVAYWMPRLLQALVVNEAGIRV